MEFSPGFLANYCDTLSKILAVSFDLTELYSIEVYNFPFFSSQSGSQFSVTPTFSTVTRQVTQQHQQLFAMYDVKQLSKLNICY